MQWSLVKVECWYALSGNDILELGSAAVAGILVRRGEHVGSFCTERYQKVAHAYVNRLPYANLGICHSITSSWVVQSQVDCSAGPVTSSLQLVTMVMNDNAARKSRRRGMLAAAVAEPVPRARMAKSKEGGWAVMVVDVTLLT